MEYDFVGIEPIGRFQQDFRPQIFELPGNWC